MFRYLGRFGVLAVCLFALAMGGCGPDDPPVEEEPIKFVSASPVEGSTIQNDATITVTFDGVPEGLKVTGGSAVPGGKTVSIAGPFAAGPLVLGLQWEGDGVVLSYTVELQRFHGTLVGHSDAVMVVAFSPDGQTLASGGADNTIRLWDVATGQQRKVLKAHADAVLKVGLAFSPDGQTLVSGSWDSTIRFWDVVTGDLQHSLITDNFTEEDLSSIALSPDGRTLASGHWTGPFLLWDVGTKQRADGHLLKDDHENYGRLAFSPDGETLAHWNNKEGSILLTDLKGWSIQRLDPFDVAAEEQAWVECVAFSPDGRTLASGHWDGNIRIWNLITGFRIHIMKGSRNRKGFKVVSGVAFSPDGHTLASVGSAAVEQIILWDTVTGQQRKVLGELGVTSVAFSPDGQILASGSTDGTIRLWDVSDVSR